MELKSSLLISQEPASEAIL